MSPWKLYLESMVMWLKNNNNSDFLQKLQTLKWKKGMLYVSHIYQTIKQHYNQLNPTKYQILINWNSMDINEYKNHIIFQSYCIYWALRLICNWLLWGFLTVHNLYFYWFNLTTAKYYQTSCINRQHFNLHITNIDYWKTWQMLSVMSP